MVHPLKLYHAFRKKARPPFIPPLKGWAFPAGVRKEKNDKHSLSGFYAEWEIGKGLWLKKAVKTDIFEALYFKESDKDFEEYLQKYVLDMINKKTVRDTLLSKSKNYFYLSIGRQINREVK